MIREFDLDAPTLNRENRSAFGFQTRSVTRLYERAFSDPLELGKAWKLLVEVVPEITHPEPRNLLGVIVVQVAHRAEDLLTCPEEDQKSRIALSWLVEGLSNAAPQLGVSPALFLGASDRVTALGFRNVEQWVKAKRSPNKKLWADVVVDLGVYEARIIGRVIDSTGCVVSERVLVVTKPNEFIFAPAIGELRWETDRTLVLWPKSKGDTPLRWSLDSP